MANKVKLHKKEDGLLYPDDLVVDSLKGPVSAKAYGQVGPARVILKTEDLNTYVIPGIYIIQSGCGPAQNCPRTLPVPAFMRVYQQGVYITQVLYDANGKTKWTRYSINSGENWTGWVPGGGNYSSSLVIYISKSGSDLNTGLDSAYPVLTVTKAMQIAAGLAGGNTAINVYLRFGQGDWGNVDFGTQAFTIVVQSYDGQYATAYSDSLPVFTAISCINVRVQIQSCIVKLVQSVYNAYVEIAACYIRIGRLIAHSFGIILFRPDNNATNYWDIINVSVPNIIIVHDGGQIYIYQKSVRLLANITADFLYMPRGGKLLCSPLLTFDMNGFTLTGRKYALFAGAVVHTAQTQTYPNVTDVEKSVLGTFPGTSTGVQAGAIINGWPVLAANNDAVVHRTGNETISGSKTFKDFFTFVARSAVIVNHITNIANTHYIDAVVGSGDNGNRIGTLRITRNDSGENFVQLAVHLPGTNNPPYGFQQGYKADGTYRAFLPENPATSSSNTSLATTSFAHRLLGQTASLTALDIDEEPTFEDIRKDYLNELNDEAMQAIYAGFPYEVNGSEFLIGCSLFDQQNMAEKAILASCFPDKNISIICKDTDGAAVELSLAPKDYLRLFQASVLRKDEVLRGVNEKKNRILAASTEDEVKAIYME